MRFKVASRVRGLSDEAFREAFGTEEQCRRRWSGCAGRTMSRLFPIRHKARSFDPIPVGGRHRDQIDIRPRAPKEFAAPDTLYRA